MPEVKRQRATTFLRENGNTGCGVDVDVDVGVLKVAGRRLEAGELMQSVPHRAADSSITAHDASKNNADLSQGAFPSLAPL